MRIFGSFLLRTDNKCNGRAFHEHHEDTNHNNLYFNSFVDSLLVKSKHATEETSWPWMQHLHQVDLCNSNPARPL
jgi:hypothetical protein